MNRSDSPSFWTGGLVGLLLTAPLLALFFLGERLVGLSLVPLDFFDFIVPYIPGGLITFVIDIMVDSIIAIGLGEDVDTVAKLVEQSMAFAMLLGVGAVVGAVFFALGENFANRATAVGAGVGLVLGVLFGAVSATSNFISVSPVVAALWTGVLYVGFGLALGYIYADLRELPIRAEQPAKTDAPEPRVQHMGRRDFLVRVGGATATLTRAGVGIGLATGGESEPVTVSTNIDDSTPAPTPEAGATEVAAADTPESGGLPNANAEVQPAPGMRPEYTPVEEHYRIDIATRPIEIDLATWTLPFSGMIAQEAAFTMDDLQNNYEPMDQYITLQCISNRIGGNLISTTKWTGVPVRDVLADLELEEGAEWLRIEGGDDFFEFVSIEMINNDPRIMFTWAFDDEPLPQRNGFPLRIYIPDRYGMKQPKWINNIVVVESDDRGYWVRRGWSADAIMQTSSVVDTIAVDSIYEDDDGTMRVPVGGYGIAGERGISKVEISIDDGEWIEALLRDPLSDKTWVFWRYDWAFEPGEHTFAVRCYDGNGDLQPTDEQGVRPDGATGIDTETATLPA